MHLDCLQPQLRADYALTGSWAVRRQLDGKRAIRGFGECIGRWEWYVIRVDRNSRGERRLWGREKVSAEGVRITLLEGMGLYLNLYGDSMPVSPFCRFYSLDQGALGAGFARAEEPLSPKNITSILSPTAEGQGDFVHVGLSESDRD